MLFLLRLKIFILTFKKYFDIERLQRGGQSSENSASDLIIGPYIGPYTFPLDYSLSAPEHYSKRKI